MKLINSNYPVITASRTRIITSGFLLITLPIQPNLPSWGLTMLRWLIMAVKNNTHTQFNNIQAIESNVDRIFNSQSELRYYFRSNPSDIAIISELYPAILWTTLIPV